MKNRRVKINKSWQKQRKNFLFWWPGIKKVELKDDYVIKSVDLANNIIQSGYPYFTFGDSFIEFESYIPYDEIYNKIIS